MPSAAAGIACLRIAALMAVPAVCLLLRVLLALRVSGSVRIRTLAAARPSRPIRRYMAIVFEKVSVPGSESVVVRSKFEPQELRQDDILNLL